MFRLPLLVVTLAAATTLAAASTAAAAPLPRLLGCNGKPLLRPVGLVVLSCADAGSELRSTRWTTWTAAGAAGVAVFGLNLCKPYCAASRMTFFPRSRVRLTRPRQTKRGRFFTRAVITYTLHGRTRTFTAYPVA